MAAHLPASPKRTTFRAGVCAFFVMDFPKDSLCG